MRNNFYFTKDSNLIDKSLAKQLLKKFEEIDKKNAYKNIDYPNIIELKDDDILKEPLFLSLLNIIQKKFQLITNFNDLSFKKLWLVNSSSNNANKTVLPYINHIDKQRYFKAMVYLHDVTLNHGPINFGIVKDSIDIEQKRKRLPQDYKKKGLNIIDEKYLKSSLTAMTGNAGDVIFFDTNTPHKAGIIKNHYYRKILRFDFERPSFNPKQTILNRVIKKFINYENY